MVKITERDLAIIAGLAGVADFLTEGRFSAPVARALKRAVGRAAPVVTRGAARFVPAAVGTARLVALRHPYIAGAAVIYVGITEREKIRTLLEQGYDVIEPAVQPAAQFLREEVFTPEHLERGRERGVIGPPAFLDPLRERFLKKRKPSSFNKAIKAGMLTVKKSTSYGGKGVIKPAKKAFSVVVKLASAKLKKKKAPKSGIRRRIWHAMRL